jgi:hypothetical protein
MSDATFWPVEAMDVSYTCGGRLPSRETTVERTACCTSGGAVSAKLLMSSGAETAGQSARRDEPNSRSGA